MADPPDTRYAKTGDGVHLAYQVCGDSPVDLVWTSMFVSHVEFEWMARYPAAFHRRLATFSRLIRFDKRGTGLSDRIGGSVTLEQRMDDIRVVMDQVGSDRAVLFGGSEGGPLAILFAATYPDRVSGLVLYASFARRTRTPDYPWAMPRSELEAQIRLVEQQWGNGVLADQWAPPDAVEKKVFRDGIATYERYSASPAAAAAIRRMNLDIDVRDVLPSVQTPTLVLHGDADAQVDIGNGRYLAEHIPNARFVVLPGQPHWSYGAKQDSLLDEIENFVTGVRPVAATARVLKTVLFTDIVSSTAKASELGDSRWGSLLQEHNNLAARQIERFRGEVVHAIGRGDGVLATFDGPARAIACAKAIVDGVHGLGLEVRAGVHTGEVEVRDDDISGIAVHIGARLVDLAAPNEILVSALVPALVTGSGIEFADKGDHTLKGLPGDWRLFSVA